MFKRFYEDEATDSQLAAQFRDRVLHLDRRPLPSPAAVQGHLLRHRDSPAAAILRVDEMF